MIPNHPQFLAAIQDRNRVCVRFYSQPDSGVLDRVCAPLDYGPGDTADGLNRYWVWDFANEAGVNPVGLVPQQILDLQVLGLKFDPAQLIAVAVPMPNAVSETVAAPKTTLSAKASSTSQETDNAATTPEVESRKDSSKRLHQEFPVAGIDYQRQLLKQLTSEQ